jgi:hypothetical protein
MASILTHRIVCLDDVHAAFTMKYPSMRESPSESMAALIIEPYRERDGAKDKTQLPRTRHRPVGAFRCHAPPQSPHQRPGTTLTLDA